MGLTIARLAAETRSFVWKCMGEDVAITYRPNALTHAWLSPSEGPAQSLAGCIVALDILDDKGKPIPLDAKSLGETLGTPILRSINQAIWDDSAVDPTKEPSSGDS